MLQVEYGRDGGGVETRGIITVSGKCTTSIPQAPTEPPAAHDALAHGRDPSRHRACRPVLLDDLAGQPVDIGRNRRDEDAVGIRPDPTESAHELPSIGLASARDAWDERQEADPDVHPVSRRVLRHSGSAIDVVVTPGGLVPRVSRGAREAEGRELLAPAVRLEHRGGHRVHVGRVEEHGGIAGDLRDRARVGRGDGTSACHRLEDRQAEALVQAG